MSAQAVPWASAWPGPHSAGLSPVPEIRHTLPTHPAWPRVACPSLLAAQLTSLGAGAERLPGASRTPVAARPGFHEGVCPFVHLSRCAPHILAGPFAHLGPTAGSFQCEVLGAAVPICMRRVCAVTPCFVQEEKGGEPGKAAACCLLCSHQLCRETPASIPLPSLANDPLLPVVHQPDQFKSWGCPWELPSF